MIYINFLSESYELSHWTFNHHQGNKQREAHCSLALCKIQSSKTSWRHWSHAMLNTALDARGRVRACLLTFEAVLTGGGERGSFIYSQYDTNASDHPILGGYELQLLLYAFRGACLSLERERSRRTVGWLYSKIWPVWRMFMHMVI